MSKKRRFLRQSATNSRQVKASHQVQRVPVVLDSGDGTPVIAMVSEEEFEELQRRQARTIKAEAEDGSEMTLTVGNNAPAGNVYCEEAALQ